MLVFMLNAHHLSTVQQCVEEFSCLPVPVTALQVLFIEGVLKGCQFLLLNLHAGTCRQHVTEEDGIRQSVAHDVVEVLEQPCTALPRVQFHAVEVVAEEVEGSHTALEESLVRLVL